jgi:hypothetical protein
MKAEDGDRKPPFVLLLTLGAYRIGLTVMSKTAITAASSKTPMMTE